MTNIYTKYNIQNEDFYNFDETGFIMEIIYNNIVVIYADRYSRSKQLQFNNQEWVTTIEYIDSNSFILLSFLII